MNYEAEKIGSRILELRQERSMTQENLADILGISAQHLGKVERGVKGASVDLLIDMTDFFDVSADYLLFGKVDNKEEIKEILHSVKVQLKKVEMMM